MQSSSLALQDVRIPVAGISCGSCARHIRKALDGQPGVRTVQVDLAAGEVTVCFDPANTSLQALVETIRENGYRAAMPAVED